MSSKGTLAGALFFSLKKRPAQFALGGLIVLVSLLYAPFLSNPLFFDDRGLFSGSRFAELATTPIGWGLRYPSYFTIAAVQVLFGSVEAQRLLNAALHGATALALFFAIRSLQRLWSPVGENEPRNFAGAALGAALFAAHPVAVYAVGYMVQRSIVLATLFSLLSLAVFVSGSATCRVVRAAAAGLLYALAVLCKEHALLAAAVAPLALWSRGVHVQSKYRYIGVYWAVCAPAAVLVVLFAKGLVGQNYEPDFAEIAAQISPSEAGWVGAPWLGSALAQAALFFRYIGLWLWPHTGAMALDLRVDFAGLWDPSIIAASLLAFVAWAVAAVFLLVHRGGAYAMVGVGMLWFRVLYLVEFSTVRFQEPFVLYRSYLWAPGLALAVAALLARAAVRTAAIAGAGALLLLFVQAHDRLQNFSSTLTIWQDAAAKLPAKPVPGAPRTLYQLGREYVNAGEPEQAAAVIERCLREYPAAFQCVFARAAIHLRLGEYASAIPYLRRAIAMRPEDGLAVHHLGLAFQLLGCRERARAEYQAAYQLGFLGAMHRIKALDSPGDGLLPPADGVVPTKAFDCAS